MMKERKMATIEIDGKTIEFDVQEYLWEQYNKYIEANCLTKIEKEQLRNWVKAGHSVLESQGSKYLCDSYPPKDFISVLREDAAIEKALVGKTKQEQEQYLKEYMGYEL